MMKIDLSVYNEPATTAIITGHNAKYVWFVFGYNNDNDLMFYSMHPPNIFVRIILRIFIGSEWREIIQRKGNETDTLPQYKGGYATTAIKQEGGSIYDIHRS
jgi:hypothetical protein